MKDKDTDKSGNFGWTKTDILDNIFVQSLCSSTCHFCNLVLCFFFTPFLCIILHHRLWCEFPITVLQNNQLFTCSLECFLCFFCSLFQAFFASSPEPLELELELLLDELLLPPPPPCFFLCSLTSFLCLWWCWPPCAGYIFLPLTVTLNLTLGAIIFDQ